MKAEIIKIGNSRGIRIPKLLIEQCVFGDTVEMRVESDSRVISQTRKLRDGWRKAFQEAGPATLGDLLLDDGLRARLIVRNGSRKPCAQTG